MVTPDPKLNRAKASRICCKSLYFGVKISSTMAEAEASRILTELLSASNMDIRLFSARTLLNAASRGIGLLRKSKVIVPWTPGRKTAVLPLRFRRSVRTSRTSASQKVTLNVSSFQVNSSAQATTVPPGIVNPANSKTVASRPNLRYFLNPRTTMQPPTTCQNEMIIVTQPN